MSARGGFALITVLWIVVALSVLVSVGMAEAQGGLRTVESRLLGRRAWWAGQELPLHCPGPASKCQS